MNYQPPLETRLANARQKLDEATNNMAAVERAREHAAGNLEAAKLAVEALERERTAARAAKHETANAARQAEMKRLEAELRELRGL